MDIVCKMREHLFVPGPFDAVAMLKEVPRSASDAVDGLGVFAAYMLHEDREGEGRILAEEQVEVVWHEAVGQEPEIDLFQRGGCEVQEETIEAPVEEQGLSVNSSIERVEKHFGGAEKLRTGWPMSACPVHGNSRERL